ncbi:crotonase/enoyl-CoA hydratase family protein [Gordonia sp. HNM0687]|uniref:Crotonase/enoyl-CoA hydratase family protein n=1 Tax=Gordonia mangrovi TaxID=2665643 RepID=A0A6L7GPG1_9ACTN|nr:crotonase/enoyl-CoA hydratase family protein [Gordonia mangrovi]MXP21760.1 crotonase/enoyl-CoA hydratase family protein [Gordonia mangrovi]UVF80489.1 crotonase/enoyl-CoA hydratase family protein [Gordonia mangrovi]
MSEPLQIEITDGVAVWTINLPQVGNAITDKNMIAAFERAVDEANADPAVRVVILTGAGHIFSAGGNVREMADEQGLFGLDPVDQRHGYADGIQRIPRALNRCEVPVIGAINGAAVGAGCDLAMMCDMRVAAESAFFAESFVQLGLIPGDGGSWFLQRAIGYERAAEMSFTGDRVDAATALEWGLVGRVVADDALLDEATALARRIAKNPPHALRMAKRLLTESRTGSLDSTLNLAAAMQPLAHQTTEHKDRVARWAKR